MTTTEAATWVRFTRLIPIDVASRLNVRACRGHVATLHERGWTADDIAHATVVGAADARNPAALIQHNLADLVTGEVPPPIDPESTPAPPPFDPRALHGPGTPDAPRRAAEARAALAESKTRARDRDREEETA